eukprot:m.259180 g.259180  ORF g.259180 m.259180 type:complete len:431 (+) comp26635_c0_seq7:397-1689(+)
MVGGGLRTTPAPNPEPRCPPTTRVCPWGAVVAGGASPCSAASPLTASLRGEPTGWTRGADRRGTVRGSRCRRRLPQRRRCPGLRVRGACEGGEAQARTRRQQPDVPPRRLRRLRGGDQHRRVRADRGPGCPGGAGPPRRERGWQRWQGAQGVNTAVDGGRSHPRAASRCGCDRDGLPVRRLRLGWEHRADHRPANHRSGLGDDRWPRHQRARYQPVAAPAGGAGADGGCAGAVHQPLGLPTAGAGPGRHHRIVAVPDQHDGGPDNPANHGTISVIYHRTDTIAHHCADSLSDSLAYAGTHRLADHCAVWRYLCTYSRHFGSGDRSARTERNILWDTLCECTRGATVGAHCGNSWRFANWQGFRCGDLDLPSASIGHRHLRGPEPSILDINVISGSAHHWHGSLCAKELCADDAKQHLSCARIRRKITANP